MEDIYSGKSIWDEDASSWVEQLMEQAEEEAREMKEQEEKEKYLSEQQMEEEDEDDDFLMQEDEDDFIDEDYVPLKNTNIYNQQSFETQNNSNVPKGGSIAVSHNNPGNIKFGDFAKKYGAIEGRRATDGGVFANFPSIEAGLEAKKDLLLGNSYRNLTVDQAMKRWS